MLDTLASLAGIAAFLSPVLVGGIVWLTRVERTVKLVEERSRELKNNGGSTLKDSVDRLETVLEQHMENSEANAKNTRHAIKNLQAAFLGHLEVHDWPVSRSDEGEE